MKLNKTHTIKSGMSKALFLCIIAALCTSCARVGYPSGGETDKTPPVILGCSPENQSTNFSKNRFSFEVDEYVNLKDVNNNVLISPPQKNFPEITSKGKKIVVEMKDTLMENTTYLFQFRDAIADNNEGNLLKDFSYVFSTGSAIDSLSFCGTVLDAFTGKPNDSCLVFLYTAFDDSAVCVQHPTYLTKTDKDGRFIFKYLSGKKYKIVALNDIDKSLSYNNASEKIAFNHDTITPYFNIDSTESDFSYTMRSFRQEAAIQRLVKSDFIAKGRIQIVSALPMSNPEIETFGTETYRLLSKKRDTLNIWLKNKDLDSINMVITDNTGINDTLKLRTFNKREHGGAFLHTNITEKFPFFDTVRITFANPVDSVVKPEKAVYYKCTSDSAYAQVVMDEITKSSAKVIMPVMQGETYEITVFGNRFYDIYRKGNDTLKIKTTVTKTEDYGTIALTFKPQNATENYVLQLLSEKDEVLKEVQVSGTQTLKFEHLKAGKYRIRAIDDENANGKWDTGNYWKNIQPEHTKVFDKELNVRENWDFEETFEW